MGKAAVIYVVGLSLIVGIMMVNINKSAVESVDTYTLYFGRTMAHNIALAAANIGSNYVLFNSAYSTNFSGTFSGGTYAVTYADTGSFSSTTKLMSVTSAYNASGEVIRDTVKAVFRYTMFSRYGWFTESETNGYKDALGNNGPFTGAADWKITGDSVFGYAHTNSHFNLAGRPYFDKKVTATTAANLMSISGVQDPFYNEGYEWGVSIKRDTANLTTLKTLANTGSPFSSSLLTNNDVGLEFFSNGSVRVRIPYNTGANKDTTIPMANLSTSKVFGVTGGDLHIKGTYSGQLTVAAFRGASGASTNKGNVWFDTTGVVANDNPKTNSNSADMLGVVAERMGYIDKFTAPKTTTVLNIQAAIYCHDGELTAQDFWNIGPSGRVSLFGSLTQKTAGSLGTFGGSGLVSGYFYSIRHDARFLGLGPPAFPFSSKYRLISWWEN